MFQLVFSKISHCRLSINFENSAVPKITGKFFIFMGSSSSTSIRLKCSIAQFDTDKKVKFAIMNK